MRSLPLIESAVQRFHASYAGHEAYPTIDEKAAAVACGLIQNHGFVDGNKRIGVAVMRLILLQNGISIRYTQTELVSLAIAVATGKADIVNVVTWIQERKTAAHA